MVSRSDKDIAEHARGLGVVMFVLMTASTIYLVKEYKQTYANVRNNNYHVHPDEGDPPIVLMEGAEEVTYWPECGGCKYARLAYLKAIEGE